MATEKELPTDRLKRETPEGALPIIVTIEGDDSASTAKIGFFALNWGEHFHIVPKMCWWAETNAEFDSSEVPANDMYMARVTAAHAVAELISEHILEDESYKPDIWD